MLGSCFAAVASSFFCAAALALTCFCAACFCTDFGDLSPIMVLIGLGVYCPGQASRVSRGS